MGGLATGALTVEIGGLPPSAGADVEVTGPDFHETVTGSTTLTDLAPGAYTIAAASVATGAGRYNPSPTTQAVAVAPATPATATVTYAGGTITGGLNLAIPRMYVVQSTQTATGAVPLVGNRDGLLRVFAVANQVNAAQPPIRLRFYHDGEQVSTATIAAPGPGVPTSLDEANLQSSWNFTVPAALVQPGLSILADIDPENAVEEGNEGDNSFPASGTPVVLDVRNAPTLRVRFVPIRQSVNGLQGDVTDGNRDAFLATVLRMHPIVAYETSVRAVYTTSAPAVQAGNGNNAWNRVLSELNGVRLADSDAGGRHYYGVLKTSYSSGVAGIGYVPGRAAAGWDYLPSAANVAAHELGHNWNRRHAPCGDITDPDEGYPYGGGATGVYGFDPGTGTVKLPSLTDVMGYCRSQWISDYTYRNVLNYRDQNALGTLVGPPEPAVLVWGRFERGEPVLEPVFHLTASPSLPERGGPFTLEGRAADGSTLFGLSFELQEVADGGPDDGHFAFTVPLSAGRAGLLAGLRLSGRGRAALVRAVAPGAPRFRLGAVPGGATLRRVAPGHVGLRWDPAAHPVVMVRDAATGQVLSFARGGDAQVWSDTDELELVASDRVRSERLRVTVTR